MENKKDIFTEILGNKLADYKSKPSPDQWETLNKSLNKKRFFYFSIQHFNIYYLFLAVVLSGSLLYFIWDENTDNKKTTPPTNPTIISSSISDTTKQVSLPIEEQKKSIKITPTNQNNIGLTSPASTIDTGRALENHHSATISKNIPDTLTEKKTEIIKELKQKPIPLKKDTIYQVDTIRVKKRKKQK